MESVFLALNLQKCMVWSKRIFIRISRYETFWRESMNDFLRTLVPMLGTALGGPLGGAAASFIADKLGIQEKTIEAVSEVLNSGKMSADQIASLKLAEIDFQKFLEANKIELAKLDVEDRTSARAREVAVKDWIPGILALLLTGGFFGVLVYMLQYGAPAH